MSREYRSTFFILTGGKCQKPVLGVSADLIRAEASDASPRFLIYELLADLTFSRILQHELNLWPICRPAQKLRGKYLDFCREEQAGETSEAKIKSYQCQSGKKNFSLLICTKVFRKPFKVGPLCGAAMKAYTVCLKSV